MGPAEALDSCCHSLGQSHVVGNAPPKPEEMQIPARGIPPGPLPQPISGYVQCTKTLLHVCVES